jgi:hypothetical protein
MSIDTTTTQGIKEATDAVSAHYRYSYRINLTKEQKSQGFVILKLDPARLARIYPNCATGMPFTILKKIIRLGNGHKSIKQDLIDMRSAIDRELELMAEDEINNTSTYVDNFN